MIRGIRAWSQERRTRRFACVRVRISSWSFSCRELWRRGLLGSAILRPASIGVPLPEIDCYNLARLAGMQPNML